MTTSNYFQERIRTRETIGDISIHIPGIKDQQQFVPVQLNRIDVKNLKVINQIAQKFIGSKKIKIYF